VRYIEESIFEEADVHNEISYLNNYQFRQYLATHGYGINLKLGMIYRVADWVRLGAAFHTPTFYSMTDEYSSTLQAKFDNGYAYTAISPAGVYDYNLTSPMRAIGSVAFIVGKSGLISADYEFVDYSEANFDAPDFSFSSANDAIQRKYTASGNLKIGTEWKYQNFSFRGGYAMYGSPFSSAYKTPGADMSKNCYSIGMGMRDHDYFIDFAYVFTQGTEYFQQYTLDNPDNDPAKIVPGSTNKISTNNISFTFGVKF